MISMSKKDICNNLCYYAHFHEAFMDRRNMGLTDSFKWFNCANNRAIITDYNYVNDLIRVYYFYVLFRMYSIEEDFFLNRDNNISNDDLDSFIHNCNFYEKPNNLTNKRLLEIVRNTFNHSLGSDLLVSKNAKNFEIDIDDIRYPRQIARGGNPEKLHMRFNIDYVRDLNNLISEKGRNILYTRFDIPHDFDFYSKHLYPELNKIKFIHYYFDKKLDPSVMQDFKDLNEKVLKLEGKPEVVNNSIKTLADSINLPKEFDLTIDQINAAKTLIEKYRVKSKWNEKTVEHFMYNTLNTITPVPALKLQLLNYELWYLKLMTDNYNFSYNDIAKTAIDIMNKKDENIKMKLRDKMDFCNYLLTREFKAPMPYMIFIDSVITNLCEEDYIEIDGKSYEVRKLRNSLVHGRWYIGNDNVYLFDGLPENKFDYDLELVGCIKLDSLIKWADNYLIEKNKTYILERRI